MAKASRNKTVYIGIKGTVVALDRRSGSELWRTHLKGSDFVNVALEGGDLLATARGQIYCLDPTSGQVRWTNPLKGFGWGLITIAGERSITATEQYRRVQEASAASASNAVAAG